MHPNGYTQEMIKEILGTAWLDKDNMPETGNQMRRRKGNEMREGKRPYPKYPSKESRIADTSGTAILLIFAILIFLTYTFPIPTLPALILLMLGILKESILILPISGIMIPYYHMNLLQLNLDDPSTIEHN